MAEDTSLFQEIDEALRADKLEEFWRRYSGLVIAFCILAVLSSAVSVIWKNHMHEVNTEQTDRLVRAAALMGSEKYNDAIALYAQTEAQGGKLAGLVGIKRAEALLALKQDDKAIAAYNDVASGKDGNGGGFADYAKLQASIINHDHAVALGQAPADTELTVSSGNAFALAASELTAVRALQAGDNKKASGLLTAIVADDSAPASQRERAGLLLESVKDTQK